MKKQGANGLGFVFTKDDPYVGVDLDGCVEDGTLHPEAEKLLQDLGPSYLEWSPSKTGVHLIGKGNLGGGKRTGDTPWGDGNIEAYDQGRYFTFTGNLVNGLHSPLDLNLEPIRNISGAISSSSGTDWLEEARKNPRFISLYDEGVTDDSGDGSHSDADFELINLLLDYIGEHRPRQILRVFQESQLYRGTDKRRDAGDYVLETMENALVKRERSNGPPINASKRPEELHENAMHGVAGEYVRMVEPYTEAGNPAMLIQFLTQIGNAMGRRPAFKVGGDRHGTNMYAAVVGDTGRGRKGTSYRKAGWPVVLADPQWDERKRSGVSTGEGLLKLFQREEFPDVEQTDTSLKVGAEDRRILLYQPEFATVLRKMRRSEAILSSILRELWDSGKAGNWTLANPIHVEGAHLSVITHITELELSQELLTLDMANGFANRFLWVCSQRSKLLPFAFENDLPQEELDPIVDRLKDVLTFARREAPESYRFTPEARSNWPEIYTRLEEPDPSLLGMVTSRSTPIVLRLAVIYAVLDKATSIGMEHLNAALAVWEFSLQSASYLFGSSVGNPVADKIYKFLLLHSAGVTRKEISTQALSGNVTKDHLDAAFQLLIDRKLIRKLDPPKKPGRPAEVWQATLHSA